MCGMCLLFWARGVRSFGFAILRCRDFSLLVLSYSDNTGAPRGNYFGHDLADYLGGQ